MELAAFLKIREGVRLKSEPVSRRPVSARIAAHQDAVIAVGDEEIGAAVHDLIGGFVQSQGCAKSLAEADVGEPGLVQLNRQRQVVECRAESAGFACHFRGEHRHPKTKFAQQRTEEAVQFVAKAAAAARYDFVEQRRIVERDGPAQMDVEIFEWNRVKMRQVYAAQGFDGCVERSAVIDAFQISGDVQGASVASRAGWR